MYSFLLIGQSNMAGRGFFGEVEPIHNDRLYVLRNGCWQPMFVPVNPDRPFSGVNLAESFADACAKQYGVDVGLIPCADGGSCIDQWEPGGALYDHAVFQAKLAMRTSTLAGILWHQGESDSTPERWSVYEEKCRRIFASLRADLGIGDVPVMVGGLGDFLAEHKAVLDASCFRQVNQALRSIARQEKMTAFVPAAGLTANPDQLHFNAASLRTFGLRYFDAFQSLGGIAGAEEKTRCDGNYAPVQLL